MKILILTQYFPPEVGASQNRLYNLAVQLQRKGADVTILTAMPNYPQMKVHEAYRKKWYVYEEMNGLKVHRCWIYVKTSKSLFPRLMNYFSFVFTSIVTGLIKLGGFDYIYCDSPPLFLGISAYFLKVVKRARLIFNVADLWPDSAQKLGLVTNPFLLNLSRKLEEFLYRRSYLITGQTMGIINNISSRFPDKKIFWLKNGAVFSENHVSTLHAEGWRMKMGFRKDDFILIYAGIFGHAQGLEVIIQAAARLNSYPEIRFILLGSGPVEEQLLRSRDEMNLQSTVTILPSVPRNDFLSVLAEADAAIIPLRRLDLFKGAIPSKIFENLLMKKPILLGVEGEAEKLFISEAKAGLAFIPEDASDLAEKILQLSNNRQLTALYGENGFNYIRKYFNWDTIAEDLWELLVEK